MPLRRCLRVKRGGVRLVEEAEWEGRHAVEERRGQETRAEQWRRPAPNSRETWGEHYEYSRR